MKTKQKYAPQTPPANTVEPTVESYSNQLDSSLSAKPISVDWSIPTDTIYRSISPQASTAIVQEVAQLFDKFDAHHITVLLRDMMIAYFDSRDLDINEYSMLLSLQQLIPELEDALKYSRKQTKQTDQA